MGGGIAMNFVNVGIPVTIVEVKQDALDRGLKVIRGNYERTAQRGGMTQDDVEKRMGLITGSLDMNALKDCRPRDRGGVRAHGHQEGHLRQARRHLQSRRDPGHQHLGPQHRRDRLGDQAAGGGHRPALLLAGQRDEAAGSRARRPHLQGGDRHLDEARQEDRQDRRAGRRLPRLRRQPHPGASASARPTS